MAEAQAGVQARVRRMLETDRDQGVTPALQALKQRCEDVGSGSVRSNGRPIESRFNQG